MRIGKIIKWITAMVMAAILGCGFAVAGDGYRMYDEAVGKTSLSDMVASIRKNEEYTKLAELPDTYLKAVVAVEDHRFYNHFGLDIIAIGRAVVNDIKAGAYVEGGSTITQQLAKNLYFSQEKKMTRKAAEVYLALELERNYTKDEILELYVNSIYFGDGYYTAGEASQGYFGKEPGRMSEYEATLLAGIPNAPSRYAPTKNPRLAAKRQQQVIRRMESCGIDISDNTHMVVAQVVAMQ